MTGLSLVSLSCVFTIVLALATFANCSILPSLPVVNYPISSNPDDVKFYLYPNNGIPKQEIIYNNQESLISSSFNFDATTVFIVHGFTDNGTVHINAYVPQAYVASSLNYNYIVVDWGLLSGNAPFSNDAEMLLIYTKVVTENILIVATRLKNFIKFLNVDPSTVHIVGHSLGAHVSGNAGRLYLSQMSKKLARISGLDPAGPLFAIPLPVPKLNQNNAVFVDIIHTNMGGLGDVGILGSGHVNFFPNGGVFQPGCDATDTTCSHQFVVKLYAASISKDFPACQCISVDGSLLTGVDLQICLDNCPTQAVLLGENCPTSARGLYSLRTSSNP